MHPKVKLLYDMNNEIVDGDQIPVQDALIMIGLLKVIQTSIMLRANGDLFPEEEKKRNE